MKTALGPLLQGHDSCAPEAILLYLTTPQVIGKSRAGDQLNGALEGTHKLGLASRMGSTLAPALKQGHN